MKYIHFATLAITLSLLPSCAAINSAGKGDKQQVEMSMHRLRTDIEELKHDLNTQQMQLGIYEGKLVRVDDIIDTIKVESTEKQKSTLDELEYHLASIEKKLEKYETGQKEILADLSKLEAHANQTSKAMSQYKDKIKEFEQTLSFHNEVISEISKLKKHINHAAALSNENRKFQTYIVKSGDSLQRIARNYNTSIDQLKRLNELRDDLIIVGQELSVPAVQ
ncbi:MAG: LysM peptidoglycan-binding domain-containing protein [Rhabdochlamydiaceae bacterium]|nr:LysM peptidoglycan-binding domain-containing protein [Candidatus Amphrikana amoebophyrae]